MASATGLISTLRLLYSNYGGWRGLFKSSYFYISVAIAALCWRLARDESWVDFAKVTLPVLAGFSVAAYAIFFAILDEKARVALLAPEPTLGNKSPLLVLASSISHAVVVQVLGLICALVYSAKPFPVVEGLSDWAVRVDYVLSSIGLFITAYALVLVVASILSIFRILEIRSRV